MHRPISRGVSSDTLLTNSLGDGSTLTLDFTTGQLDPRLTFSRASGGTYTGNDGLVYGMDFATSSSLAIGTGSKSVTLTATAGVDRRYLVGQTVYFSNGANNMSGPVTAYNASTQVLTINATATSGSGSFTSWSVGNASARFDHDPTTLAPRGLLIEGSATNLLPNSQTLSGTGWFTGGICTRTSNYATGPDGIANSATRLEMSFSGGVGRTYYDSGYTTLPQTMSVWLKSNTGSNQTVNLWNTSGTPVSCTVTPTWKRFQSVSTTGSSLPGYFYFENPSTTVAVDILAWGAQLEAGSGASSYIPTGASQATRNGDICTMNDITALNYSTTNGTMLYVGQFTKINSASYPTRAGFQQAGGNNPSFEIFTNGSLIFSAARSAAANPERSTTITTNSSIKFATAFDASLASNEVTICLNGGTVLGSSATGLTATYAPTIFALGRAGYELFYPSGTIAQVKYWPTTLPNATLQSLTT